MKLLISEVLQKVSNAKTKAEKIKILREHNTSALRSILIANYDESIISLLPEGDVPFTSNDAPKGTDHTVLEKEYRRLYLFFKGGSNSLKQAQRENLFIQMLEGLNEEEAHLLILAKDKALQKKYKITRACVEEAFPQIKWGGRA
ncbi:hypothetical protein S-PM2d186 [Synechococcus phage S-PM2]|uniref:Hypothetical-Protein / belonging to T4-LIKE GC: 313 n=1 Tax=Synechococcus phage S-PM2 TaxID=238854 RepID=Q5GQF1_BPSYP|nr:Hypothetical-Protein / belonging to T4-LIKE GC: 313 [Synechococcus phage S-PM2]CAF34251.1 Hypothetical-Protein / belonging to T4-LIKE GC: 313 [Synechococcus phage S-PM2]CFW42397.1 hypothetical protein S-PM2d186 [Synechococcus phage S-PM2]